VIEISLAGQSAEVSRRSRGPDGNMPGQAAIAATCDMAQDPDTSLDDSEQVLSGVYWHFLA
jgi:hypothetical protein